MAEPTINEMSDEDIANLINNVCAEYKNDSEYLTKLSINQLLNFSYGLQYFERTDALQFNKMQEINSNLSDLLKLSEKEIEDRVGNVPLASDNI